MQLFFFSYGFPHLSRSYVLKYKNRKKYIVKKVAIYTPSSGYLAEARRCNKAMRTGLVKACRHRCRAQAVETLCLRKGTPQGGDTAPSGPNQAEKNAFFAKRQTVGFETQTLQTKNALNARGGMARPNAPCLLVLWQRSQSDFSSKNIRRIAGA